MCPGRGSKVGKYYETGTLSCVRPLYCLRKSKEFHDMRKECQIILIHFLLLISHESISIAK